MIKLYLKIIEKLNLQKYAKILFVLIELYLLLLLFLLFKQFYWCAFLLIVISLLIIMLLYKKKYQIKFINIDFIKKRIKYIKIKSKFKKKSIYSSKMNIATFDGSNEFTHPSVLYFKQSFNGYKFWMAYTPYSNCNVSLENPCIAVSNDGVNFVKPENLTNPLLPIIEVKDKKKLEYYNDPNLIFVNDKLELWYRLTKEDKINNKLSQKIFRMCSKDGIQWSKPQLLIDDIENAKNLISISLLYKNDMYYLYYFDLDLKPTLITSNDLKTWSSEIKVVVDDYDGKYWHGEIKKINGIYKFVFVDNTYNLYISTYADAINFSNTKKINILCKSLDYFYIKNVLYKTSMVEDKSYYYFYVPFRFDNIRLFKTSNVLYRKWITTVTKIKKENIDKIEEELK